MNYTADDFASDLRESIRDYRNPRTTCAEMKYIIDWWAEKGIKNQFQAAMKVSEIERPATPKEQS